MFNEIYINIYIYIWVRKIYLCFRFGIIRTILTKEGFDQNYILLIKRLLKGIKLALKIYE